MTREKKKEKEVKKRQKIKIIKNRKGKIKKNEIKANN